jgi:hypothetical protein
LRGRTWLGRRDRRRRTAGSIKPLAVGIGRGRVLVPERAVTGEHRRDDGRGDAGILEGEYRVGGEIERGRVVRDEGENDGVAEAGAGQFDHLGGSRWKIHRD